MVVKFVSGVLVLLPIFVKFKKVQKVKSYPHIFSHFKRYCKQVNLTEDLRIETMTIAIVVSTGNWQPNQSDAGREKLRTCNLRATTHVGANWRLRLNFAVDGGRLRVWNEQGTTTMDLSFVADDL